MLSITFISIQWALLSKGSVKRRQQTGSVEGDSFNDFQMPPVLNTLHNYNLTFNCHIYKIRLPPSTRFFSCLLAYIKIFLSLSPLSWYSLFVFFLLKCIQLSWTICMRSKIKCHITKVVYLFRIDYHEINMKRYVNSGNVFIGI